MKKIIVFLVIAIFFVACNRDMRTVNVSVIKFEGTNKSAGDYCKCVAVAQSGDTLSVMVERYVYLGSKLPIEGRVSFMAGEVGPKWFEPNVTINPDSIPVIITKKVGTQSIKSVVTGYVECKASFPNQTEMSVYVEEAILLQNKVPFNGHVSVDNFNPILFIASK